MDEIEILARDSFGYGRWDAPVWFIGLEQGGGDNRTRAKAFQTHQSDGLCDCKNFHDAIGEYRWHGLNGMEAELQPTWKRLMMLLGAFCGAELNNALLLRYQKELWGREEGQTCAIEIDGLSAKSLSDKDANHRRLISKYRFNRIAKIRQKLRHLKPLLVVMYGYSGEKRFQKLTSPTLKLLRGSSVEQERTSFLLIRHPTDYSSPGNTDDAWKAFGREARKHTDILSSWPNGIW
jgi:hypothetical protein